VRLQRGQEPENKANWAETRGNWRRIQSWFRHMNIHTSTRALAGIMQTILNMNPYLFNYSGIHLDRKKGRFQLQLRAKL
jgi:hypothetical protein